MTQKQESPAGDGGAFECLAGRLDASEYTQNRRALQDSAEIGSPRYERQIERLHRLGPRSTSELLIEIAHRTGESKFIADRVEAFTRLDPGVVRVVGADHFPPMPLGVVR